MTVENTTNFKKFQGDSVTTVVSFSFRVLQASDLKLYAYPATLGFTDIEVYRLTEGIDYEVDIDDDGEGGFITYTTAVATGMEGLIQNDLSITQPADLPTEGNFSEESVETALDRSCLINIQQQEILKRCIKLKIEDPLNVDGFTGLELAPEALATRAGKLVRWNSAGDGLENAAGADIELAAVSSFVASLLDDADASAFLTSLGVSTFIKTLLDDTTAAFARATLLAAAAGANTDITSLGVVTGVTAAAGDNSTKLATTAYADGAKKFLPNWANASTMISQRPFTINLSTTKQIGQCDNIAIWASGGSVSAGTLQFTSSAAPAFQTPYAARAAGVTLTGSGVITHAIAMEGFDAVKYRNRTVSVSAKVYHDVGSSINYTLVLKKPTTYNGFGTLTTIGTSGVTAVPTATATIVKFEGVSIGDTTNGLVLEVQAACGAVTTKNFDVSEFTIEPSSTAGQYIAADHAVEFARCQRYLPGFNATSAAATVCSGHAQTATAALAVFPFKVSALRAPTGIYLSSAGHFYVNVNNTNVNTATITYSSGGSSADAGLLALGNAGFTANAGISLITQNASGVILFTGAEMI